YNDDSGAVTTAYPDELSPDSAWMDTVQARFHRSSGLGARWQEGPGALHGIGQGLLDSLLDQTGLYVLATQHEGAQDYAEGNSYLTEAPVAINEAAQNTNQPSAIVVFDGKFDQAGRNKLEQFYDEVADAFSSQLAASRLASIDVTEIKKG